MRKRYFFKKQTNPAYPKILNAIEIVMPWLVDHSTENAFLEFLITFKYLQIIYLKTLI